MVIAIPDFMLRQIFRKSDRSLARWRSIFIRSDVRFIGGVVFAILAPLGFKLGYHSEAWADPGQRNTALCVTAGILIGIVALRHFEKFPSGRSGYYVVPVMITSCALVQLIMLFGRLDYNRYLFMMSFLLGTAWLFTAHSLSAGARQLLFLLVPGGRTSALRGLRGVIWLDIEAPVVPEHTVSGVVADLDGELDPEWCTFLVDCALAGIRCYDAAGVREALAGKVDITRVSGRDLAVINPDPLYMGLKSGVDRVLAVLVLCAIWPVLVLLVVIIRLDSPGGAIFRQQRIGLRGQPFLCYKFRTMVEGADGGGSDRAAAITLTGDHRITRLGRHLRRWRLDELPQIFNIAMGEMSWIGPRPEVTSLSQAYATDIALYRFRHGVRPGLTGWAQVNQGHVHRTDEVREKLQYDFYYIKHMSVWLDALIALRTIKVIVTGFGAK